MTIKGKAPEVAAVGASQDFNAKAQFSRKSTRTEAQEERILAALRERPQTTDALRALGCYQSSARIHGLRARGYNIVTELFDGYAADGMDHSRLARYSLIEEAQATLPLFAPRTRAKRAGKGLQ